MKKSLVLASLIVLAAGVLLAGCRAKDGASRSSATSPVRTFTGHKGVRSVAFSPDGQTALSGSTDNTLKLWQLPEDVWPEEAE